MLKYILILVFVAGIMGPSLVSLAGEPPPPPSCVATVKCVCESAFKTRVVHCPTYDLPEHFFTDDDSPGTVRVDCSIPLTDSPAVCEDLDIHCKWWERPNCLLTLPIFVAAPPPTPTGPTGCCLSVDSCEETTEQDCPDDAEHDFNPNGHCSGSACAAEIP